VARPCGGRAGGHHGGGGGLGVVGTFFVSLLVLGVVVVAAGVWWSQFASEDTKAAIQEVSAPVLGLLVSSGMWVQVRHIGGSKHECSFWRHGIDPCRGASTDAACTRPPVRWQLRVALF
jgi:hypothetical protein